MVSGERCLTAELSTSNMKEMIGGCCVCSDERGWAENPLVYCDGHGCNVAVHQACYGIVQVPTGPWFCRKCESQERAARVGVSPHLVFAHCHIFTSEFVLLFLIVFFFFSLQRCELCPHKDGALKRTDNGGWAHVVCALYIPEVEFANVSTMEPIVLQSVPHERYNKTCYICEEQGRESKAATGACMTCNKHGYDFMLRIAFLILHTNLIAQFAGLLCEEQGSDADNVKYCGYCKYHHSKLRRSRGRGSRSQSLSDSSSLCMDRPPDQDKQKHKERDRHKPKHKKGSMDMSPSLVLPNIMVPDKTYNCSNSGGGVTSLAAASQKRLDDNSARFTNANFQEVSSAHPGSSSKDGLVADAGKAASEVKSKKNSGGGHAVGQRGGRKSLTSSGKPLPSAVVTMATSSTSASVSTGPFHQGLLLTSASKPPSAPSSSDFLSFSDSSLRPGGGTSFSSPPSFSSCLVKPSSEGGVSEGTATLFGSLIYSVSLFFFAGVGGKLYENSLSHAAGETTSLVGSTAYKRPQPSSSGLGIGGAAAGAAEDGAKKKKKGNWRNRFGPCFTTDVKPSEAAPSLTLPTSSTASTAPSSSAASTSGLGVMGIAGGIQKSPSLLRNGSLQSNSSSTTAGSGSSSGTGAVAMGGTTSELSQQQQPTPSLAPPSSPFTATVGALPGSVFNLAPPHMFGNRLNPNSTMAALIAQSEASPAGTSTHLTSPIGGLQIRYDSSGSLLGPGLGLLGAGGCGGGETLPPVATSIEQLLERQWNEGQSFLLQHGAQGDVVGMLKSLHQLQEENRRLEEQIKTLTMKKERLQLLSAQLSVPFTPSASSGKLPQTSRHFKLYALCKSLKPPLGSSCFTPKELKKCPNAPQDASSCGGHSSSGSTSSLSASPSVSQSPPQPVLSSAAAATAGLGGMTGLMGSLGAGHALGIVGALNGVIQTPAGVGSPHSHGAAAAAGVTLPITNRYLVPSSQSSHFIRFSSRSASTCFTLTRCVNFPSTSQDHQQQALLYRLMQQQQDLQQLQSLSSSSTASLPINNLLPGAQNPGQGAIAANPFLALQHAHTDTHGSGQPKPRLAEKAVGVAGQEKT
uniref:MLLT10 histone lysine methyltransferase DOT1L cofactor n=1 Tax=Kryptolebias marmoratus TaxID=37003 RepID=A0A3Q3GAM5_KRYMA